MVCLPPPSPNLLTGFVLIVRRAEGYETRFGVTYVDYEGGQKRYPKKSATVVGPFIEALIKKE